MNAPGTRGCLHLGVSALSGHRGYVAAREPWVRGERVTGAVVACREQQLRGDVGRYESDAAIGDLEERMERIEHAAKLVQHSVAQHEDRIAGLMYSPGQSRPTVRTPPVSRSGPGLFVRAPPPLSPRIREGPRLSLTRRGNCAGVGRGGSPACGERPLRRVAV